MRNHLWKLGMNSVQIEENYAVKDSFLRERIAHGKRPGTREFVALSEGVEAGLLIFEHFPSTSLGFVYEIFVLEGFRGLGIGNLLLSKAEDVALESACTMLHLTARSLDQEFIKDDDLKSWYLRKGFIHNFSDSGDMLKRLTGNVNTANQLLRDITQIHEAHVEQRNSSQETPPLRMG
jgi:GNAT superfamily N-acetyltransferase